MKWCVEEENDNTAVKNEGGWEQSNKEGRRGIRGCVATEVVNYVVKVEYEFVLETHKMLCFRATTAVGEIHCLDLLTTSKALMLLRVPSRHPPVSMSF